VRLGDLEWVIDLLSQLQYAPSISDGRVPVEVPHVDERCVDSGLEFQTLVVMDTGKTPRGFDCFQPLYEITECRPSAKMGLR